MRWLGIRASFSRPGVSDDNAHVEAFFRTLKYRPSYPTRGFESLEHARAWTADFVRWYSDGCLTKLSDNCLDGYRHRRAPCRELRRLEHAKDAAVEGVIPDRLFILVGDLNLH